jgi:hypothetical protein
MTVNSPISTYIEVNNPIIHGSAPSVDVYFQPFSARANLKRENQKTIIRLDATNPTTDPTSTHHMNEHLLRLIG